MLHEPAGRSGPDRASAYKMRLGAVMFLLYGLIYSGFVAINVVNPTLMETPSLLGMNLACVYGFGLIVLALVLALIYNHMCTAKEKQVNSASEGGA